MKRLALPLILASLAIVGVGCPYGPSSVLTQEDAIREETLDLAFSMLDDSGQTVKVTKLKKRHIIGKSSCPDEFPPFTVTSPSGRVTGPGTATTDAKWLFVPESVKIDEPVKIEFNCNIGDFSAHIEDTTITFDFGDEATTEAAAPVHDYDLEASEPRARVQLQVHMGACTDRACPEGFDLDTPPPSYE